MRLRIRRNAMVNLFLIFSVSAFSQINLVTFSTNYVNIGFDRKGNLYSLQDKTSSIEYVPKGIVSPLLSLFKDSAYLNPVSMEYNPGKKRFTLKYSNGSTATISCTNKGDYLRFELLSLTPRKGVEAIVWGPIATSIGHMIGETVGVVRDKQFAIGVQSVNVNTIEGLPDDGDDAGGGHFIDPLPGQTVPESLKDKIGQRVEVNVNETGDMPDYVRLYRGSLAVKKPFGSELRLFARDRRIPGTIGKDKNLQYVAPINEDFAGSSIALFGCPEPQALNLIEKIELGEGLPHPMLDGVWLKRSPRTNQPYMMYEGGSLENCLKYAKEGNFKLVHIGDVFKSWGHFGLETTRFPNGAADIMKFTKKAKEAGISIGVHTLTAFTGTNDPYVSPVPSDSLLKAGSSILAKDIGENDDIIYVKDPEYFYNTGSTHTIKIGKELISYKSVSASAPWHLTGCVRGQFKTMKAAHKAGVTVDKLLNSGYNGFLPDYNLMFAYAKRLASVCNETGIDYMDFDGFESVAQTGHGTFADNKFIDTWYKQLDRYRLTCGSTTSHYYWHVYSFMNWGEPWYSALRKSQVNYRIENQRYFERNFMPGMLGWFALETEYRPEEIEWIQARSAGFNAGFLLRVDENIEKSGYKTEMLEAIREWQLARNTGSFTAEQIEKFKDPKNEFHLKRNTDKSWELFPVSLQTGFEHKFKRVQTGEPVLSRIKVNNPYEAQPLQFYITAVAVEGDKTSTISNINIALNNYQSIEIQESLKAGDKLVCDGKAVFLCDAGWKKIKEIKTNSIPSLSAGENDIVVKSDFSGQQSPFLKIDFKTTGKPELVNQKD